MSVSAIMVPAPLYNCVPILNFTGALPLLVRIINAVSLCCCQSEKYGDGWEFTCSWIDCARSPKQPAIVASISKKREILLGFILFMFEGYLLVAVCGFTVYRLAMSSI